MKARFAAHSVVGFILWPVFTIAASTVEAGGIPYYHLPLHQAVAGSAAGVLLLAPDFLLIGLMLTLVSALVFSRFGRPLADRPPRFGRLCTEPLALLAAIFCGTCLWYPAVLSHAFLIPFWPLPSWAVLGLLAFIGMSLVFDAAPRGRRIRLAAVLGALGVAVPIPSLLVGTTSSSERPVSDVVVLGIDSLAQTDDVAELRRWIRARGGAWYEQAVSPSLVTNAVWASVMTMQPVRDHGVFHAFQPLPSGDAPLLRLARQAGYRSVAVFPDQTTCAIGSEAGFDEDRSGPVGWRQLATATVQNSSVLLPLVRPLLPWSAWSAAPPNQAGTFTYDLQREIREILTNGRAGRPTFVAAHLTYLHIATYPRLVDLSWAERLAVASAPAGSVRDRSFDWDDVDQPEDALPLRRWKVARVQSVLAGAVDATGFVERGGKLLVFSDHGDRVGLTPQTFTDAKYHHVVMATLGLPERAVERPTSLIDIAALAGFAPPDLAADPVVEFAIGPPELWIKLAETSRIHWSGEVDLDAQLLGGIFRHLRAHRPWAAPPGSGVARVTNRDSRTPTQLQTPEALPEVHR